MKNQRNIWLIGGTSNAVEIAKMLVALNCCVTITVTTDYGAHLASVMGATVLKGTLSPAEMQQLIESENIDLIIDASHPFATEVSMNAMEVARKMNVAYWRFERKQTRFESALYVDSYEKAIEHLQAKCGKILLTTGSKYVHKFSVLGVDRLLARVLSTSESVKLCEEAGLKASNIIAMHGVGTVAFNVALMHTFNIKFLVTKDSGDEGGMVEKMEAATQAGAQVIIIQRPTVNYPKVFSEYNDIMQQL